jgi:hypothetical protein
MWHTVLVSPTDKPLVMLSGEINTPPLFGRANRSRLSAPAPPKGRGIVDAAFAAHGGHRTALP